jgi:hypothetical protein
MDLVRRLVERAYDFHKERIFQKTKDDPERAHEIFIKIAQLTSKIGLDRILLDCQENKLLYPPEISNAAGFNKNGDIPPSFMRYLGFDRIVIGTVTAEPNNCTCSSCSKRSRDRWNMCSRKHRSSSY